MRAPQPRFFGRHGIKRLDQLRIECPRQRNGLWKTCPARRGLAVQTFFVKNQGNAQAAVFDKEFLDRISEFGHAPRVLALSGVAGSPDLPKPVSLFESSFGFSKIEIAIAIEQQFGFFLPDTNHLRRLFVHVHPSEQIADTLFDGQIAIFVSRFYGLADLRLPIAGGFVMWSEC